MKKEKQIKENLSNEINPEIQDPLTEVLREGARKMLAKTLKLSRGVLSINTNSKRRGRVSPGGSYTKFDSNSNLYFD